MGLGALRKGMMHTEFRASLIRHHRPSLWAREPLRPGPPQSHPRCHPAARQGPFPLPHLQGCLLPVLLPHPRHQEVPGAGELEAVDEAHLGGERCEGWSAPPNTGWPARQGRGLA